MPNFSIIDSHLHIWDREQLRYPWLSTNLMLNRSYLVEDYDAACGPVDVEAMIFLECDAHPFDALAETTWVEEQAARDPRIKAIVAHAPLQLGRKVLPHLNQLAQNTLVRGVRRLIQAEPDPYFCVRPEFIEGVQLLGERDWSFDACIVYPQMDSVIQLADACSDVRMVLDHFGKPNVRGNQLEPWLTQLNTLSQRKNVFCKLSGLATEADFNRWQPEQLRPFIRAALDAFGPDRLMFGGDWPVSTQAIAYPRWVEVLDWALSDLNGAELKKIYRDTASRFYRLNNN